MSVLPAAAQTVRTWNTTSGTWNATTSWDGGVAAGANDIAYFSGTSVGASDATVFFEAAKTVVGVSFNSSGTTIMRSNSTGVRVLTLGTSGITVASGAGAVTIGVSNANVTLTLNGTQTFTNDSTKLLTIFNPVNTSGIVGSDLTINGSGNTTISSAVSGSAGRVISLRKEGAGLLRLNGANTFAGGLTLAGGTLALGSDAALGGAASVFTIEAATPSVAIDVTSARTTTNNNPQAWNGDFTYLGNNTLDLGTGAVTLGGNRTVTVNASTLTVGGGIVDSGSGFSLTKAGAGTLRLTGINSYSGGTLVSAGRLVGTTDSLLGTITNDAAVEFSQAASGTYAGTMSGSGSFTKSGTGVVTVAGANSYTGATTISAGRLVGSTASLPGAIANASQLEFAQATAGTFPSVISGTGSLTKTGAGNLILAGTSTYTGTTSVDAGRLSVNGALGTSPVAVLAAAELGGSGSIGGPVSVASGGFLAPGNSIASLATGTTTLAAGATFAYDVDSANVGVLSSAADLLVVSGNLNLDAGNGTLLTLADLNPSPNFFVEDTTMFAMINYSGSWNGGLFTYDGNVLEDGERFRVGDQTWQIDYNRTSSAGLDNFTADYLPSSSFVAITAVPEPSTAWMALAGIACGGFSMWRRRK